MYYIPAVSITSGGQNVSSTTLDSSRGAETTLGAAGFVFDSQSIK